MLQLFITTSRQILEIANTLKEGELRKVICHGQCRSIFSLKRNLDKLSQLDAKERAGGMRERYEKLRNCSTTGTDKSD